MNELLEILAQFGGGRGDPGNNVVRFLLPAIFWCVLIFISIKQWLKEWEKRDIIIGIAAFIGLSRELLMFIVEFGSWKGFLQHHVVHHYYPPIEHAISMLASVLIGYAFLRYFKQLERFSRFYLFTGITAAIALYLVTAPAWLLFLKEYPQAFFGEFWGDMAFRITASVLIGTASVFLINAALRGTSIPAMLILGFLFLFFDEFLMIFNLAAGDTLKEIYGPIRHNLHIWAIPMFTSVYWTELTARAMKSEERLTMLNRAFLDFETDAIKNINTMTALAGELLGGTCAIYSSLKNMTLCTVGQWQTSPDFASASKPEGHICYDIIRRESKDVFVVRNLSETPYAESDQNILRHNLQTYVGMAVKSGDITVGSLCVGYQKDYSPSEADRKFIGIIASAIGVEEERRQDKEIQKRTSEELRTLSLHQVSIRERERTLIAREIHDELGQSLTALNMDLAWLKKKLPSDNTELSDKTSSMAALINTTIQSVKRICTDLRPSILDDFGLIAAIEWQAEQFQNRTGMFCKITTDIEETIQGKELSTTLFRVFQEALTNIARHAKATIVKVRLEEKNDLLEMEIDDNGIGIKKEHSDNRQSFGIIGIRERVLSMGGDFRMISIPNRGTILKIKVPLHTGEKNDTGNCS